MITANISKIMMSNTKQSYYNYLIAVSPKFYCTLQLGNCNKIQYCLFMITKPNFFPLNTYFLFLIHLFLLIDFYMKFPLIGYLKNLTKEDIEMLHRTYIYYILIM